MNKTIVRCLSFALALALALGASSPALASAEAGFAKQGSNQALSLAGKVYYVSITGSDTNPGSSTAPFKTFAKASSVLMPGDTLQVMPGRYSEALIVSKSGTAGAPITVIGNGAIVDVKSAKNTTVKISGSYINLSGFEIMGAVDAGLAIPGKYVTVKNNVIHDNVTQNGIGTCGAAGSWSSALKVSVGGQNITIDGNTIFNNCGEGIAVTRGVNVTVQNNTSYDNWAQNIYIDNSPYSIVQNNLVYCTGARLRADGKRPSGIGMGEELYSGWGAQMHDVLISGNTVRDCGKGIGAYASQVSGTFTNVTITRNYIPSGELRPIALSTSPNNNVVISYNTMYTDPYISDKAGVTLIGNTIGNTAAPTSTPVTINTPTPTAVLLSPTSTSSAPAPPPTLTATTAATIVPSQQVSDGIFASGFESGDLTEWNGSSNGGGDLSVSPSAALVGSNGLQAVINDTTAMFVSDASPNAEPRYRARFYFDPNSVTMAGGDYMYILQGYSGTGTASVLRIEFRNSSGVYQVRARALDNASVWKNTALVNLSDGLHVLEVDWIASEAGASNGSLMFWVDGVQQGSVSGIANDTYRMETVRLGVPYSSAAGASGTVYFDHFESRRQSYIGP